MILQMAGLRAFAPNLLVPLATFLAAFAISLGVGFGLMPPEGRPLSPIPLPSPPYARGVYFAPIGAFPVADAEALIAHYRQKFGLTVGLLPSIPMPDDAFDPGRSQVVAERLIETIGASQVVAADPGAIVIGLTSADMYVGAESWRYAYGLRAQGHLAIVSTGRMDAYWADHARLMGRLEKMVTRDIGVLYFGLPLSDDPGSVLYRDIGGPDDLDRMSEDF
jgi:hypothetical protein